MDTLTQDQCQALLEEEHVAHIGVITAEGPYVTPISFVSLGDGVAFRSLTGRRLNAIKENPRVSFEITEHNPETGSWRSVIASGSATLIEDPQQEASIIQQLLQRYTESFNSLLGDTGPTLSQAFVVRVDFDGITGRSSGTFLQPKTRPGRL